MALKFGENQNLIMRCYECYGEKCELSLQGNLPISLVTRTDLLENPLKQWQPNHVLNLIKPWQISTFEVGCFNQ
jgi:alpha-mannosidase